MIDNCKRVYDVVSEYFETNGFPYEYDEELGLLSIKSGSTSFLTIKLHKDGFLVSYQLSVKDEIDMSDKDMVNELYKFTNMVNERTIRGKLVYDEKNNLFIFSNFEPCYDNVPVYEQLITVLDITLTLFISFADPILMIVKERVDAYNAMFKYLVNVHKVDMEKFGVDIDEGE